MLMAKLKLDQVENSRLNTWGGCQRRFTLSSYLMVKHTGVYPIVISFWSASSIVTSSLEGSVGVTSPLACPAGLGYEIDFSISR
jgi:hypothetical protein